MKRRTFLASSVVGITALSGCTSLFGSDDEPNDDEDNSNNDDEPIEIPHEGLEEEDIQSSFVDAHFSELRSVDNFTISHQKEISDGSVQDTTWARNRNIGYQIVSSEGSIKEERYYGEDVMGVRSTSEEIVNLIERPIPPMDEWANADLVRSIIEESTVEVTNETEESIEYTGLAESDRFDSPQGFTLTISKDRPLITAIEFSDLVEKYELTKLNQTSVDEPTWYTRALQENVIVTGGGYDNANALILSFSESQQRTLEGFLLTVIDPSGSSNSVHVDETVEPGDEVYLISRYGNLYYSINQLPAVSDKDELGEGLYTLVGATREGNHLFEIQLNYSNE